MRGDNKKSLRKVIGAFLFAALSIILSMKNPQNVQAAFDAKHYDVRDGGTWDGTYYYTPDGEMAKNCFFCDGTYTYFLTHEGTPMTNRLTYHPDGEHIIYFDENGHEVFDNFAMVKQSIEGNPVDDMCYFNTFGYMYIDFQTYDISGTKQYYANPYGVVERNGWFYYPNGDLGFANADGTLLVDTFTFNASGQTVYLQANGHVKRGIMTDGAYYYYMDERDGHLVKQVPCSDGYVAIPNEVTFSPTYTDPYPTTNTKKGLQGEYGSGLGNEQTLFNFYLNDVFNGYTNYTYNGKTYKFKAPLSKAAVSACNANGIAVSAVLLLKYNSALVYPGANDGGAHAYYGWNVTEEPNKEMIDAALHFLAETYGTESCHIDNWILGNEVNMPNAWNYTGTTDPATNVNLYATEYLMLYNAVKSVSLNSRVSISVDHSWNHNDEGRGIAAKQFIDMFASTVSGIQTNVDWCIAFHPYPAILTNPVIWNEGYYTTQSQDTMFISCANLNVLTDYIKNTYGSNHRIYLSELGFTASYGEAIQAAGIAYSYYAAECNDMVDAIIFRAYQDTSVEAKQNLYFGLLDLNGNKRQSYEIFKYMDTVLGEAYTEGCRSTIGITDWSQIVPNYSNYSSRFKQQ